MKKRMAARYPGRCGTCDGAIAPGQQIDWDRDTRITTHVVCPPRELRVDGLQGATPVAAAQTYQRPFESTVASSPAVESVEPLLALAEFLAQARENGLVEPKLRFLAPKGGEMKLKLNKVTHATYPSHIVVTVNGVFRGTISPRGDVTHDLKFRKDLLDALREVEKNPALAAHTYAALTGRCTFCNLPLTDEGSVQVGYGPICAMNYNLPHIPLGTPEIGAPPVVQKAPHEAPDPITAAVSDNPSGLDGTFDGAGPAPEGEWQELTTPQAEAAAQSALSEAAARVRSREALEREHLLRHLAEGRTR